MSAITHRGGPDRLHVFLTSHSPLDALSPEDPHTMSSVSPAQYALEEPLADPHHFFLEPLNVCTVDIQNGDIDVPSE
jgi:hypothetical protein